MINGDIRTQNVTHMHYTLETDSRLHFYAVMNTNSSSRNYIAVIYYHTFQPYILYENVTMPFLSLHN